MSRLFVILSKVAKIIYGIIKKVIYSFELLEIN